MALLRKGLFVFVNAINGFFDGLAQGAGVPMSSHIFPEISAHLLAVTPTAHWLERMDLAGPVLAQPLRCVDGCAVSADVPGSGVSWNEDAVRQYQVR